MEHSLTFKGLNNVTAGSSCLSKKIYSKNTLKKKPGVACGKNKQTNKKKWYKLDVDLDTSYVK